MNHVKIWFAKKGTHPLGGVVHELRLIRQSESYFKRGESLSLLTDFSHASREDIAYVQSFCAKNRISLITTHDIERELNNIDWIDKAVQLQLFNKAMMELTHSAGHPVIASDIFRLLSPVLVLGAYSDIDNYIEYKTPGLIDLQPTQELLYNFNLKVTLTTSGIHLALEKLNTNFIFARNTEHHVLVRHRRNILTNLTTTAIITDLNVNIKANTNLSNFVIDASFTPIYKSFCAQYFRHRARSENLSLEFRKALSEDLPQYYQQFFYFYVMTISGPFALVKNLVPGAAHEGVIKEISDLQISNTLILIKEEKKHSDLSWMNEGAQDLANAHTKITNSVLKIQGFWRKCKKPISPDSAAVEADIVKRVKK